VDDIKQRLNLKGYRRTRYAGPIFDRANLNPHYYPFRGLVWSFVVHASIFTALATVTLPRRPERSLREQAVILDIDELEDVLYLPLLRPTNPDPSPKPAPKAASEVSASKSSKGKNGLSYPGPQPILSDFPNATNHTQTLLQPTLKDPYILQQPLLLPNIVRIAESAAIPRPAAPLVEPKLKVPDRSTPAAHLNASPQLDVALNGPTKPLAAPLAESKFKTLENSTPATRTGPAAQLDVALANPAKPLAAPLAESKFKTLENSTPAARTGPAAQLDMALANPAKPLAAPLAEKKLKMPDSVVPAALPGTAPVQFEMPTPVAGTPPQPPPPKPAPPASTPNDSKQNLLALSPTPGRRDQPVTVPAAEGRGRFAISPNPNLDFPGTEPGLKNGTGAPGVGGNATESAGSAVNGKNGGTSGPNTTSSRPVENSAGGTDAFPGITILGASVDPPTSRNSATVRNPEPLQTSYGITILSSGRGGGGLPDFGVFSNEQVHTVYVDMRRTVPDSAPPWTAEYALLTPPTTQRDEPETAIRTQNDIVLPFPISKEQPAMPADLVRKYPRRMVIVFGIINAEGKMEHLSVKDSPDPLLSEIVLKALKNWTFRPARRNGEIFPAKALLGIPLWAPE
jgi:hypothetical protein